MLQQGKLNDGTQNFKKIFLIDFQKSQIERFSHRNLLTSTRDKPSFKGHVNYHKKKFGLKYLSVSPWSNQGEMHSVSYEFNHVLVNSIIQQI